jgi:hypothetical protein
MVVSINDREVYRQPPKATYRVQTNESASNHYDSRSASAFNGLDVLDPCVDLPMAMQQFS